MTVTKISDCRDAAFPDGLVGRGVGRSGGPCAGFHLINICDFQTGIGIIYEVK